MFDTNIISSGRIVNGEPLEVMGPRFSIIHINTSRYLSYGRK